MKFFTKLFTNRGLEFFYNRCMICENVANIELWVIMWDGRVLSNEFKAGICSEEISE